MTWPSERHKASMSCFDTGLRNYKSQFGLFIINYNTLFVFTNQIEGTENCNHKQFMPLSESNLPYPVLLQHLSCDIS